MLPSLKQQMNDLLAQNQPATVLATLSSLTQAELDADAFYLMGIAHYRLKSFVEAEGSFQQALSLEASNALAFYYLGLCAERQGDTGKALKCYQAALALNPSMKKAQAKLVSLSSTPMSPGTSAASQSSASRSPRDTLSELSVPTTDEDMERYRKAIEQKKLIDARAERKAAWRGRTLPMRVFMVLFFLVVIAFMLWVVGMASGIIDEPVAVGDSGTTPLRNGEQP